MVAATKEEIHTVIQRYIEIGTDELILVACVPEVDQVARLADALGSSERLNTGELIVLLYLPIDAARRQSLQ